MKRRVFILFSLVMCSKFAVVKPESHTLEDSQSGKTLTIGDGVKVEKLADSVNKTSSFSWPILRAFLGDVGLSLAKEKDGLQIGLFTPGDGGLPQARGHHSSSTNVFSVLLPLLIGFKIAGSIIITLIAVLIVSIKAFLASIVSLILAAVAVMKKMMNTIVPAAIHYPMDSYEHHPPMAYNYPSAHDYHPHPPYDSPPTAPSAPAHDYGHPVSKHPAHSDHNHVQESYSPYLGSTASAESNLSSQLATKNATNTKYQGIRRRVFKKSDHNVPIFTVSKIIRKENY